MRTSSPTLDRLNAEYASLEEQQEAIEERILELQAELDGLDSNELREHEMNRLQEEILFYEGAIERANERLTEDMNLLSGAQDRHNTRMELWRTHGFIA